MYPDAEKLAAALADLFVDRAQAAVAERGAFYVALAGGTTPRAAYALLAAQRRAAQVAWQDVFVYFGDERCVGPDDEQSNYKMACDTFLRAVPIPPPNVRRMRGEDDPTEAARLYAEMLRADLGDPPAFDLVLLGMGSDGHTASLFPGTDPMTGDADLVRAPYVEAMQAYRLTLTPRAINNARHVAIAAQGAQKATILASVLEGPYVPTTYPVQIVAPRAGRLTWLVDRDAADSLRAT
ncbi:MAG: 6-phosphogluconolactonase [Vulcanimicrobiaceae bacterium]